MILSVCACAKVPDSNADTESDTTSHVDESGDTHASSETAESESETADETGTEVCEGFDDELRDPPLQIALTNARAEPIYLMQLTPCTFEYLHIVGDGGRWPAGMCEPTCGAIVNGLCQCPDACVGPHFLRIEPGSSRTIDWFYVLTPSSVPELCAGPDCTAGPCPQAIAPPDGGYLFSIAMLSAPPECEGPDDPCACGPDQDWCEVETTYDGAPDLELEFEVELPDGSLELAID